MGRNEMAMGRISLALVAVASVLNLTRAEGDVQSLESEMPVHHRSLRMSHVAMAGETMASVQRRTRHHRSFNILGFFGCCYHCKHEPSCTERCMKKHNIQNGFGAPIQDPVAPDTTQELSHERLAQAAEAIAFIQEAAGTRTSRDHKPIKLHLDAGSSTYHKAPARPQPSQDAAGVPKAASKELATDSQESSSFSIHEFFHCAFNCKHELKCEESCLQRHHVLNQDVQYEHDDSGAQLVMSGR